MGAGLDENIDIGLKEKLSDDDDSDGSDDLDDFFQRNKKAEEAKRLEQTRAYYDASQAHEQSMMNPDMSRALDHTMNIAAIPEEDETPNTNTATAGGEDGTAVEGEEGQAAEGEDGEAPEGEGETP